ncbi:MAG: hypothetical protein ACRC6X_07565 [Culicoidibacterales bacterium]
MKILFLKSATLPLVLTLAEVIEGKCCVIDELEQSYFEGMRPSEIFFDGIVKLLERNGLSIASLGALYIASGPGSYTGTRIAVTIAKTIAVMLPTIKVYWVSILAIYRKMSLQDKQNVGADYLCLVLARKGKYYARFKMGKGVDFPDMLIAQKDLEALPFTDIFCNGAMASKSEVLQGRYNVQLAYDIWYELSRQVHNIHTFEPYYLEGVNIG